VSATSIESGLALFVILLALYGGLDVPDVQVRNDVLLSTTRKAA
jgi:hypothetical protein